MIFAALFRKRSKCAIFKNQNKYLYFFSIIFASIKVNVFFLASKSTRQEGINFQKLIEKSDLKGARAELLQHLEAKKASPMMVKQYFNLMNRLRNYQGLESILENGCTTPAVRISIREVIPLEALQNIQLSSEAKKRLTWDVVLSCRVAEACPDLKSAMDQLDLEQTKFLRTNTLQKLIQDQKSVDLLVEKVGQVNDDKFTCSACIALILKDQEFTSSALQLWEKIDQEKSYSVPKEYLEKIQDFAKKHNLKPMNID